MDRLIKNGCIKYGNFKLKNGEESHYYVDLKSSLSDSKLFWDIIEHINTICNKKSQHIVGIPYGALPYASVLAYLTKTSLLLLRKESKEYGLKKLVEGKYNDNDTVTIVEDVITSGRSILEQLSVLQNHKLKVNKIIVIVDRETGGMELIKTMGYDIESIFKISDLIPKSNIANKIINIANHKKSNIVLSNDLNKMDTFFETLELLAPHICAVKTHVDIIEDYDESFITRINQLKQKYNFVIIEDQKYSDIATIVYKKYNKSIYKIKEWADIVTMHGLVGTESVKILTNDNVNILLVAQLSSKSSLIDEDYTEKVIKMGYNNNVLGFISQKKISTYKFLYFTPGINIDNDNDGHDQIWNHPDILAKFGSQFFIVGRSIYESNNCLEKTKQYKQICWDAVLKNNPLFN